MGYSTAKPAPLPPLVQRYGQLALALWLFRSVAGDVTRKAGSARLWASARTWLIRYTRQTAQKPALSCGSGPVLGPPGVPAPRGCQSLLGIGSPAPEPFRRRRVGIGQKRDQLRTPGVSCVARPALRWHGCGDGHRPWNSWSMSHLLSALGALGGNDRRAKAPQCGRSRYDRTADRRARSGRTMWASASTMIK